MDYEFFERLSQSEAEAYRSRFLELESRAVEEMLRTAAPTVELGYSIESIVPAFNWLRGQVTVRAVEPAADTPAWIRDSMEADHGGFLDFDDESRPRVLRAGYFFGQCFVASHPALEWALGRPERVEFQQPVVTGFSTDADLPALVVAENLLLMADQADFEARVVSAVAAWRKAV